MDILLTFFRSSSMTFLSVLLAAAYVCLAVATTIHILLYKEDIKGAIGWIAIVFLSPFLGTFFYVFLGINRVKRKGIKLRKKHGMLGRRSIAGKQNEFGDITPYVKQFIDFSFNVYPQNFAQGNNIKPLLNGTEAYPEMIDAISKAKKEVLVESYIFDADNETDKFLKAFKQAAKNGAAVKVIIDGFGTLRFFRRSIEKKLAAIEGVECAVFLPPLIPISMPFVNLRNHRKIMIIDGKTAFFGGMNLSKKNVSLKDLAHGVQDITFKIEGPVIDQMSEIFEDDWEFATGHEMTGRSRYVHYGKKGGMLARVVPDGPDKNNGKIESLLHGRINMAKNHIVITTPYFLPENEILTALELAAQRGVLVEVFIPEISDHIIMNWAEEPNFKRLLKKGVKIYRTPQPFDHSKIFIVDGEWACIGSTNWDVRSFKLHFEADMEIISKNFAAKLLKIVKLKKKISKPAQLQDCLNLPFLKRLRNNAFRLITPYY
ncbi:phospholipase D-like domain-containing protein [Endomicrobium proavitum]|uniref:Cardiolipin synthase n=1 Tax=Endomicrobium proavitum TaxID=1408281 RepID=A0A0G3WL73_9BACT|nr:phospholipase D-like domain-containing protein [Endomicrobium proavitum]AKL98635.1 Cardiolipin synthase [Endomicrobium proavitum]